VKSDKNGCSNCPAGQESYEIFSHGGKQYYQYDYRADDGLKLFSVIKFTLKKCRESARQIFGARIERNYLIF